MRVNEGMCSPPNFAILQSSCDAQNLVDHGNIKLPRENSALANYFLHRPSHKKILYARDVPVTPLDTKNADVIYACINNSLVPLFGLFRDERRRKT